MTDSLQLLQTTELHSAFKTDQRQYLKDIYYSNEKIEVFRTKCIEREETLVRKFNDVVAKLKDTKEEIKREKNDNLQRNKNIKELVTQTYPSQLSDLHSEMRLKLESIYNCSRCLLRLCRVSEAFGRVWHSATIEQLRIS